jgi:murein DD-endopeptidase MepM/ murein hydrolase activator NlpD
VSTDISALIQQARANAGTSDATKAGDADRQKLLRIAQEFESMLLGQVLKDMRRAGKWDDEEDGESSGFGAESLFEMADAELAGHLARVQGLGLSKQLLEAFDRMPIAGAAPLAPEPTLGSAPLPAPPRIKPVLAPVQSVVAPTPRIESHVEPAAAAGSPTVRTVDGHVTSNFGWRRDPFTGQSRFHRGVDLAAVYGEDVQAARGGRVVFSGGQGGYGNTVVLEHPDGTRSRYAHLSATLVSAGDAIDAGKPVGRAGHSGRATGTHVHFEVTTADGRPVAPDAWIKKL